MSFLGEIKRRKVFQVAAVYAVVAWLLIQVITSIETPLSLPDWVDTLVIVLLAIGFPITLIISWAFNLTPEGLVREQKDAVSTQSSGRRIEYVLIGLLVVAVGWLVYRDIGRIEMPSEQIATIPSSVVEPVEQEEMRGVLPNSVAVLPCENLSLDPENAFFAAGIHYTILNELAKIRDMNVIARASVLQFADRRTPISQIAEELNVETVMECTVQYAGGEVRITAQLIDPETGSHLWSKNYDNEFADIFVIQSEIATLIAMALKAELLPSEQQAIDRQLTNSPEAYALYLKAVAIPIGREANADDVRLAISYFDQAIDLDDEFAFAYAERGIRLRILWGKTSEEDDEIEREGLESIERALNLDPKLGLAHVELGNIHAISLRPEQARIACETAIEFSPNDSVVLARCARVYAMIDQPDETIALARRALELDPDNAEMHQYAGESLLAVRQTEEAIIALRRAVQLNPRDVLARVQLGRILPSRGNQNEALEQLQISESLLSDDAISTWGIIAYGYGLLNRDDDAARAFAIWEERQLRSKGWHSCFAYLGIQDYAAALSCINETAQREYYGFGPHLIKVNAFDDPVLEQPEFVEARNRLGVIE